MHVASRGSRSTRAARDVERAVRDAADDAARVGGVSRIGHGKVPGTRSRARNAAAICRRFFRPARAAGRRAPCASRCR
jgi:hypothetical protein